MSEEALSWAHIHAEAGKFDIGELTLPVFNIESGSRFKFSEILSNYQNSSGIRTSFTRLTMPLWVEQTARRLIFIFSGSIDCGNRRFERGDLLLVDRSVSPDVLVRGGECRLVEVLVPDDWAPVGLASEQPQPSNDSAKVWRMYMKGDLSFFEPCTNLFGEPSAEAPPWRPVNGFYFVRMSNGYFINWHPELVNLLVLVLCGSLQLETSGDGVIQTFEVGDICSAEDKTGKGHTDLAIGDTVFLAVDFPDGSLWP